MSRFTERLPAAAKAVAGPALGTRPFSFVAPQRFKASIELLPPEPCLLVPLLETRERLRDAVEENFDCQYSLHVEFTGLLSWGTGARIDWHYDSNRPYLKQRHYTAVLYLNSAGFTGGDLLFQLPGGNVQRMTPQAGRAVMYEAGACSVHAVDQVTSGERHTLAMWFTKDEEHDEDARLLGTLRSICGSEAYAAAASSQSPWRPTGCEPPESLFASTAALRRGDEGDAAAHHEGKDHAHDLRVTRLKALRLSAITSDSSEDAAIPVYLEDSMTSGGVPELHAEALHRPLYTAATLSQALLIAHFLKWRHPDILELGRAQPDRVAAIEDGSRILNHGASHFALDKWNTYMESLQRALDTLNPTWHSLGFLCTTHDN
ncbi:hypothetical protein CYMTET_37926 [Cymbomonas tetramitiformis]|uniref:procollagen-proline 3-dioxygenase n=1 Tax=Cymbomonas tetramitiformis TaxID=36881 RepID=A0AAE0CEB9_9CHLO|nr:hypothetical protein CYMTET_37926 [Cymbomonas tetramitiformis]